jgi:serine/threonine-protein kinase
MASVYLGSQVEGGNNRLVALKVIKEVYSLNHEFVTMFSDEAKLVSRLSHPNIVQVYELGAEGNRLFMAMEFLNGQSLWHVWNACRERGVRLRYDVAAWIGARVAEGLHHAHEFRDPKGNMLNIVHRDVNASNIFITYDGQVKVIDFGLAKVANRLSKTRLGMVKGKLAYMSPEQAVGQPLDRRTDIFALGTTLWEVTADQRLFKAEDDTETLERVHAAVVPDPTQLVDGYPQELWLSLRRALQRDPNARFRDCSEMAVALDRFAMSEGRAINQTVIAGIMQALFAEEKAAHEKWIAEASVTVAMGREMLAAMRPGISTGEALRQMPDRPSVPGGMTPMPGQVGSARPSQADILNTTVPMAPFMMTTSHTGAFARSSSVPPAPPSEALILTAKDFAEGPESTSRPASVPAASPSAPPWRPSSVNPGDSRLSPVVPAATPAERKSSKLWLALVGLGLLVGAAIFVLLYVRRH